jgi:hypothetical protein
VRVYRLYGFSISSDLALPELPQWPAVGEMAIRSGRVAPLAAGWYDIWPNSDGRSWVRACRTPSGYQVRHGELAAFDIDRHRRAIAYDAPGCDEALLRHFLVDHIVPLMLSLDATILHASSVEIGGGTRAFVGPGGAGKSTLALALARAGHGMVSDDGLLLRFERERVTAAPAYAGVRLWRDSAAALRAEGGPSVDGASANKSCYRERAAFSMTVPPLASIYVVDPRPAPMVIYDRVTGADAAIEIVRQTYRLALDDRDALTRQLDDIVALARTVAVWRLAFPRGLESVAALAASVAAHIAGHAEVRA